MAEATVIQASHGILQSVASNNDVLRSLKAANRFNVDAPENFLFLSSNDQLAAGTNTVKHASNHPPISQAQTAILNAFGAIDVEIATAAGQTKILSRAEVMLSASSTLSPESQIFRNQLLAQAEALATDLRDFTNQQIADKKLTLTQTAPKYADLPDDAARNDAWKRDVNNVYSEFDAARQSQDLLDYRQTRAAIQAAGGGRALDGL